MQSKSVQKTPYLSRRAFLTAAAAAPLAACSNGLASEGGQRIDIRVDNAMQLMYREVPGSQDLEQDAAGMLIMPLVTEAGFGFGGS
ncbi:MAG: twin-arginine translocation pathway signal, partial [Pseudomonadota bacterium]